VLVMIGFNWTESVKLGQIGTTQLRCHIFKIKIFNWGVTNSVSIPKTVIDTAYEKITMRWLNEYSSSVINAINMQNL